MAAAIQSLSQTACMDCPPHLVGLLIGKKGWTIKKIQTETGAQVGGGLFVVGMDGLVGGWCFIPCPSFVI